MSNEEPVPAESPREQAEGELLERAEALLEVFDAGQPTIGAGFVAGLSVSLAAAVVATAARSSREGWREAGAVAGQAEALRRRSAALAGQNARAHAEALAALESTAEEEGPLGRPDLGEVLVLAAEAPLAIAEAAADVADLAATTTAEGQAAAWGDANGAAVIAAAAAAVCARLIEVNLTAGKDDPRVARAAAAEATARAAAERALASRR